MHIFITFFAFSVTIGTATGTVENSRSSPLLRGRNLQLSPSNSSELVQVLESTAEIFYVDNLDHIPNGAPDYSKVVRTLEMRNNAGVHVTAMAEGGTMLQLSLNDQDYLWNNVEGGAYYHPETDIFPLRRGLILHGGSRFAAVAPEHGLYYDTDWDMSYEDGNNEKSIILRMTDNEQTRQRVGRSYGVNPFSQGHYNREDMNGEEERMSKYPITNLTYTYKITLRPGEDFVRLTLKVDNPTDMPANAEAWLNMAFPVKNNSIILDQQKQRWRRDEWVFPQMSNIIDWSANPTLFKPLSWPGPANLYDFPSMDGNFHGVVSDPEAGRGIVYVAPETTPHYTMLWSWGDPIAPRWRERPFQEYYEPWSSGFNPGFFQTYEFKPHTCNSWQLALVPIESGLTSNDKNVLVEVVKDHLNDRPGLTTIDDVRKQSC